MTQNIPGQQQIKTRRAVLIFLKVVAPPLVLYVDNPEESFNEIKRIIETANIRAPRLIEQAGKGPLKKISVLDTQIAGVALQDEPA